MLPSPQCELQIYLKSQSLKFCIFNLLLHLLLTIPSANLDRPRYVAFMSSLCVSHVPQAKLIGTMKWNCYWKNPISHCTFCLANDSSILLFYCYFLPCSQRKGEVGIVRHMPKVWTSHTVAAVSQHPTRSKYKTSWSWRTQFWAHWIIWQKTQAGWTYGAWDSEHIVLRLQVEGIY